MRIFALVFVLFGTLTTPVGAEPYFDCGWDGARVGVGVWKPNRVQLDFPDASFEAPATIERTRSMVLVSFQFLDSGRRESAMLVANLNGAVTLERSGEPSGSTRERVFACEIIR